jgi:hypothetical protein
LKTFLRNHADGIASINLFVVLDGLTKHFMATKLSAAPSVARGESLASGGEDRSGCGSSVRSLNGNSSPIRRFPRCDEFESSNRERAAPTSSFQ